MQFLLTGGTGFIGRNLCRSLQAAGHQLTVLSRRPEGAQRVLGPQVKIITSLAELDADMQIDCIVNLAGEPIMGLPWTQARRASIVQSRIGLTQELVQLIARLQHKPATLINGSAIGYYGIDAGPRTETDPPSLLFQSQLCAQWEQAAMQAELHGVRVVCVRTGLVLDAERGALPELALPVKLGAGFVLGSGQQWVSWIHLHDMLALLLFLIDHTDIRGPVNATAPNPVTHRQFMQTLAQVLHRPLLLRIPAFVLRGLLGEMAQLLVDGQQVLPAKAAAQGFTFSFPLLEPALQSLFQKPAEAAP